MTGEELKKAIRTHDWKMGDVAKAMGMSQQSFSSKFNARKLDPEFTERVLTIIGDGNTNNSNNTVNVGGDAANINTTLDHEVVALFREQLNKKDEQIATLLEIIKSK